MPIEIHRRDGLYSAVISPPHGTRPWRTQDQLPANELVDRLRELGCHTTDIADAFVAAHPRWLDDTTAQPDQPARDEPALRNLTMRRYLTASAAVLVLHVAATFLLRSYRDLLLAIGGRLVHGTDIADLLDLALAGFAVVGVLLLLLTNGLVYATRPQAD